MSKRRKNLPSKGGSKNTFFKRLADQNDSRTSTKFMRSGVDLGAALAGGLLGAAIGKYAALFGLGVLVTGNFVGDKTGLYKTVGSGMLVYGVAKVLTEGETANKSVQGLSGTEGMKERIGNYKDELMSAFYLDKIFKKKTTGTGSAAARSAADEEDESVGALDLSALDFFEDYNHQQANEFEINREASDYSISAAPYDDDDEDDHDEQFSYAIINDMPDMNNM